MWSPVPPNTSEQLHQMLGESGELFGKQRVQIFSEPSRDHVVLTYDGSTAVGTWQRNEIEIGRQLPKPLPLFKKLDDSVAADEISRLGN
jgi:methionyl-tRNA synthetase